MREHGSIEPAVPIAPICASRKSFTASITTRLELTVTINDPKMYTKPWVALDKLRFKLKPPNFDVREMICSPSEFAEYNKVIGKPASGKSAH